MAQKVVTSTICDLPHKDETAAPETIGFAWDGNSYEIDVCQNDATRLREVFAPYVGHARTVGSPGFRARGRKATSRAKPAERAAVAAQSTEVQPLHQWRPTDPERQFQEQLGVAAPQPQDKPTAKDVRAWAREHGIEVSPRGNISASVVQQYMESR